MKRKDLALTTAMAATLTALGGCSSGNDWDSDVYARDDTQVCVDQNGYRVDDGNCERPHIRGGSHYGWFYLGRGSRVPYYGDSVRDPAGRIVGSATPNSGTQYTRAPSSTAMTRSAATARGGFGSSGHFFGGGRS